MPVLAVIALAAAVIGVLIGAVGIGGVALPPLLVWVVGLDPHAAAGTSSWSFLFTGIVGTAMYARGAAVPWRLVGLLSIGIVPSAVLGSLANGAIPDASALLPLAVLVTAAGIHTLWSGRPRTGVPRAGVPRAGAGPRNAAVAPEPRALAAISIGAVVGFCSALTGTGGPVILVPILLAIGVPALASVAAAQVVQLPLVAFAVLGYASRGDVDFGLGSLIGAIAAAGAVGGAAIAMRLPQRALRRLAGIALASFGAVLLVATLAGLRPS